MKASVEGPKKSLSGTTGQSSWNGLQGEKSSCKLTVSYSWSAAAASFFSVLLQDREMLGLLVGHAERGRESRCKAPVKSRV